MIHQNANINQQVTEDEARIRYRGVSYTKPITAAKEAVPVVDLAGRLTGPSGLRRVGGEWAGRCPLPDHEDRTPSFTVNPEKNVFFCHGCLRGGDVIELARLAWDYPKEEAHVAAGYLLMEFGVDLPERPPSWFAKQRRQHAAREAIDQEKIEHIRMLVFRLVWVPWLRSLPESMRGEAAESAWEGSRKIARMLYDARRAA
jgi:hypothetical protein